MSPKEILRIREILKLTQQQLADTIGAQRHTVARWETGVNEPRGANLKLLRELAERAKKKRKA
jgi:DNA-binding transcriptional regulator YiaG